MSDLWSPLLVVRKADGDMRSLESTRGFPSIDQLRSDIQIRQVDSLQLRAAITAIRNTPSAIHSPHAEAAFPLSLLPPSRPTTRPLQAD